MRGVKELEDENCRLKKCTLKNGLMLKSPRMLSQKSGEASSATRTGLHGQS